LRYVDLPAEAGSGALKRTPRQSVPFPMRSRLTALILSTMICDSAFNLLSGLD
jgi:hypothetical protein